MAGRIRVWAGWLAVVMGAASLVLFAVAVYEYRAGGWPWPQALDLSTYGVWAGMAGLFAGVLGLMARRGGGLGVILLGIALSLPMSALGVWFDVSARLTPPINDISTDTADPPVFWFTATPSEYPPANAAPQRATYPDVQPLALSVPLDAGFDAALGLIKTRGWQILSADRTEAQIEAIATSPVFGFQDEVAIRLTAKDGQTRIDMRSRSRLGLVDRGANARRIIAFLSELEAGLKG